MYGQEYKQLLESPNTNGDEPNIVDLFVKILKSALITDEALERFITHPKIVAIEKAHPKVQQQELYHFWYFELWRYAKETMNARNAITPDKDIPEWLNTIVDEVAPVIVSLNLPFKKEEMTHEEQKAS